jgi:ribosomal protein S18 acetylase RimI-like enzyme
MAESERSGGAEPAVRRAVKADAGDVARLLHDFNTEFDEPTPPVAALAERVEELLDRGEITVLLAGAAEPVGLALLRFREALWAAALDAYLEELYVVPARRGGGIGRALLEAAMQAARAAGATHFELTTGETDTAARGLYESAGFSNREGGPEGPRMLYYERDL